MIPKYFQPILWEYDLEKISNKSDIVLERAFNLGNSRQYNYLLKSLGKPFLKRSLIKLNNSIDKKSLNYWKIYFDINKEKKIKPKSSMYDLLNKPIFERSFK